MSFAERKQGHRAERLERIIAEALEYQLLPELEDPRLQGLRVLRVEVVGNLSGVVAVLVPETKDAGAVQDVEAGLESAERHLRSELASMLRIKHMPTLRLKYLPFCLSQAESGGAACES